MPAGGSSRCWADLVGDCGGPISREHYVSRTLWLSPHVTVSGLPGSDGPRTFGLDAMVIRSMCRTHNEALSDLDRAAGDVVRTWRRLNELRIRTALAAIRARRRG